MEYTLVQECIIYCFMSLVSASVLGCSSQKAFVEMLKIIAEYQSQHVYNSLDLISIVNNTFLLECVLYCH